MNSDLPHLWLVLKHPEKHEVELLLLILLFGVVPACQKEP